MRLTEHAAFPAIVVVAISAAGLVLSFQGWKARIPNPNEGVYAMHQALDIVTHGTVPDRGTLTDFGSYFPPGTAWLMVPGVLLTADARLIDLVGAALLYAVAIAGVFALGRMMFGARAAALASVLYAVSYIGMVFSSDLWPRAHPAFLVWMAYFAARWVTERDGRAAAASLLVWAAGMYFYMELAPALLMLPALWLVYRPPLAWPWLAGALALALVLWQPFLAFQWDKDFVDIKSQVFRQWVPAQDGPAPVPPASFTPNWRRQLLPGGLGGFTDTLPGNLETRVLAGDFVLLVLLLGGLATSAIGAAPGSRGRLSGSAIVVAALVAATIVVNEFVRRWVAPDGDLAVVVTGARRLHIWLIVGAAVMAVRLDAARSWLADARGHWRADVRPVLIALTVPWIALLLVVEWDRYDRAYGFWPLQALLIAACAEAWARRAARPAFRWLLPVMVVLIAGTNNYTLHKVRAWADDGWAGVGPEFMPVPSDRAIP